MKSEEQTRQIIDGLIGWWRDIRDGKREIADDNAKDFAKYYIDAYQTVRINLFGETLPPCDDSRILKE